ncbi:aspartate/glutamate racemase family protein [Nocardioides sp. GXZ039]|uniref:aspartate/glutamate racemase family protein n=1 Tax=Nocardioides sp. GXZ039 TaxID=3136018 RepID=UPI0030F40C27
MKTIGLVGGMSWHSTATYYRLINEEVAARRGGHSSARISLQSLDFAEVRACQERGDWTASAELLAGATRRCVAGGAELVGLCTNLMHKNFPALESAAAQAGARAVHIADAVAAVAARNGSTALGLLGTRWVMEETFYADRLATHGISVLVPDADDRGLVDRVIFDELTQGIVRDDSRGAYVSVMDDLRARGAEAVVLACTEIDLLISATDSPLPLIDSTDAHASLLVDLALA